MKTIRLPDVDSVKVQRINTSGETVRVWLFHNLKTQWDQYQLDGIQKVCSVFRACETAHITCLKTDAKNT